MKFNVEIILYKYKENVKNTLYIQLENVVTLTRKMEMTKEKTTEEEKSKQERERDLEETIISREDLFCYLIRINEAMVTIL